MAFQICWKFVSSDFKFAQFKLADNLEAIFSELRALNIDAHLQKKRMMLN